MKITKEWLISKKACGEGVVWFENQSRTDTNAAEIELQKKEVK